MTNLSKLIIILFLINRSESITPFLSDSKSMQTKPSRSFLFIIRHRHRWSNQACGKWRLAIADNPTLLGIWPPHHKMSIFTSELPNSLALPCFFFLPAWLYTHWICHSGLRQRATMMMAATPLWTWIGPNKPSGSSRRFTARRYLLLLLVLVHVWLTGELAFIFVCFLTIFGLWVLVLNMEWVDWWLQIIKRWNK